MAKKLKQMIIKWLATSHILATGYWLVQAKVS
jgi:hypothetical protein